MVSIVLMHLLCNALRVFLGVMVVALVGGENLKTRKSVLVTLDRSKLQGQALKPVGQDMDCT